jgi:hypothetical protein
MSLLDRFKRLEELEIQVEALRIDRAAWVEQIRQRDAIIDHLRTHSTLYWCPDCAPGGEFGPPRKDVAN